VAIIINPFDAFVPMATGCAGRCSETINISDDPREIIVLLKRLAKIKQFPSDLVSSEEKDGKLFIRFVDYEKEPDKTEPVLGLKVALVKVLRHLKIGHEATDDKNVYVVHLADKSR